MRSYKAFEVHGGRAGGGQGQWNEGKRVGVNCSLIGWASRAFIAGGLSSSRFSFILAPRVHCPSPHCIGSPSCFPNESSSTGFNPFNAIDAKVNRDFEVNSLVRLLASDYHSTWPCASIRRFFHLEIEIHPALPPDPPPSSTTKSRLEDSLARSPPFPLLPSTNFIPPPSLPPPPSQPAAPSPTLPSRSGAAWQQPRQPHRGQLLIKTSSSSRKNEGGKEVRKERVTLELEVSRERKFAESADRDGVWDRRGVRANCASDGDSDDEEGGIRW